MHILDSPNVLRGCTILSLEAVQERVFFLSELKGKSRYPSGCEIIELLQLRRRIFHLSIALNCFICFTGMKRLMKYYHEFMSYFIGFSGKDKKSKATPSIPESGIFNIEVCLMNFSTLHLRAFRL